jgi:adenine phosphoribosyltransferase
MKSPSCRGGRRRVVDSLTLECPDVPAWRAALTPGGSETPVPCAARHAAGNIPAVDVAELRAKIRDIKNFPTEGVLFKDITTLLKDAPAFRYVVDRLSDLHRRERVEVVVGIESRGFIFGGAVAHQLQAGFVPVRKLGKLPGKTIEVEYELEYGRDALAMHADAIRPGQRVLAVDDLLATGGTMAATLRLIEQLGGQVVGVTFLIELAFLGGREKLKNYPVQSLIVYD